MIRLRFVTGNDLISEAIRAWQKDGWATHVEAVLPDGSLLGAHEDGVKIRPAGYDKATMTRELFVELDGSGPGSVRRILRALTIASAQEEAFYAFLVGQVGKPYDNTAIAGLVLGRDWREDDSWICSELMAAALEVCSYFPKLSSAVNHISPRDLLLLLSGRELIADAA